MTKLYIHKYVSVPGKCPLDAFGNIRQLLFLFLTYLTLYNRL